MNTNPWDGLQELIYQSQQLGMSPEQAKQHAASTLAHRQKLKEQEERRNALWQRLLGKKETMLYEYNGGDFSYNVSVAWGVSWDGLHATVDITIGGDGYPSCFDFKASSALKLMKRIEQEPSQESMQFTVARDDYWHDSGGIRGDFSLNQQTVQNLLKWLEGERPLLEQLAQEAQS